MTADTAASGAGDIEPVAWCSVEDGEVVALSFARREASDCVEPLYSRQAIDTLRAQLEAAERGVMRRDDDMVVPMALWDEMDRVGLEWKARAEAAEAEGARLRVDAERYAWLKQHDVGIGNEGFGDWAHYAYADAEPNHGRLGLDATIDAARNKAATP